LAARRAGDQCDLAGKPTCQKGPTGRLGCPAR
jgi:hypothetical protein